MQLLHSDSSNPSAATETADPWPLILAQPEATIVRTRARAVLHLQQNRPKRWEKARELAPNAMTLIGAFLEKTNAQRALRKLVESEDDVLETLDLLRREIKSSKDIDAVSRTLARLRDGNQASFENLVVLLEHLSPAEAAPDPLRPLALVLPPLLESVRKLRGILSERNLPEGPELDALRKALTTRDQLKQEALTLHKLVTDNLRETDRLIGEKLENFSPERLNQVDRAILRLAATELRLVPDLPPAVAINEAIEIARRFGDTESSSFVNGVLDRLKPANDPTN